MGDAYNFPTIFPEMIACSYLGVSYWLKVLHAGTSGSPQTPTYNISNLTAVYNLDGTQVVGPNGYDCKGSSIQTWCATAGHCR